MSLLSILFIFVLVILNCILFFFIDIEEWDLFSIWEDFWGFFLVNDIWWLLEVFNML